jgi:hypothetical protein
MNQSLEHQSPSIAKTEEKGKTTTSTKEIKGEFQLFNPQNLLNPEELK